MCCVFVHTNIDNTRRASSPLVTLCGTGAYASGASLATVSFREEFFSETRRIEGSNTLHTYSNAGIFGPARRYRSGA